MKLGIILTATVARFVKGGYFTAKERMEMYISALRYYQKEIGKAYPIIFVENSNADLSPIREEFKETLDLTIYQFRPDDAIAYEGFDASKGKGYNEYLMISKAVVANGDSITHYLKITGRYPMINIRQIIHEIERNTQKHQLVFMGDVKDTKIYDWIHSEGHSSHWGDSRFFMFEKAFYLSNMAEAYKEMTDYVEGFHAEDYILNFSRRFRNDKRMKFRYKTQVVFGGISGARYQEQYDSKENRRKVYVRQLCRYILPFIWF
jgi:hypothetical protein